MKKRLLALLLALLCLISLCACTPNDGDGDDGDGNTPPTEPPDTVTARITQKIEGTDITWKLYSDGKLEFTGTGEIPDYDLPTEQPWRAYGAKNVADRTDDDTVLISATKLVIGEGITRIGDSAFEEYESITEVTLAQSVTEIGFWAFKNCTALKKIKGSTGLTHLEGACFKGCGLLEEIALSPALTAVDDSAFEGTGGSDQRLTVHFSGNATAWEALVSTLGNGNDPLKNATVAYPA